MHANARVTSKGQITIPAEIREALGVGKGDVLVFETAADYVTVRRQPTLSEIVDKLAATYTGSPVPLSDKSDDELVAEGIMANWAEREAGFAGPFVAGPGGSFILKDGELVPYEAHDDEEDAS